MLFPNEETVKKKWITRDGINGLKLLLFLSPFLVMVVIFNYIPIFGWILAFINYRPGIPIFYSDFVGL
jgi:ABC-type polysaccharide transport system permease subunit